jgi:hypothetical protein
MARGPSFAAMALSTALVAVPLGPSERGSDDQARLSTLLRKSAEYCRRLDRAALDFVCLEEVTEDTVHFTYDQNVYLYDYQFIKKGGKTEEKRVLVSINHEKARSRESPLQTVMFQYRNVLFGPVGLLSAYWQNALDYKLVGEDRIGEVRTVVVRATPKEGPGDPHPYGRIWIKEDDGSVLKISWDQRSLGKFKEIEEFAKSQSAEPAIDAYSEYGFEKNGLRFPSRNFSEQGYILSNGQRIAKDRVSTVYKKYKFFTVETEVGY